MKLRVSGIVNDSIVDGPGLRLTVFTQGCTHNCKGCHNPQTHDMTGGYVTDTDEIRPHLRENPLLDGLTLSGGEPFLQCAPCALLAQQAHAQGLNVWIFTGYLWEDLLKDSEKRILLKEADVLIDGPFIESERSLELQFCGSKNQRLIDVARSLKEDRVVLWKKDEL